VTWEGKKKQLLRRKEFHDFSDNMRSQLFHRIRDTTSHSPWYKNSVWSLGPWQSTRPSSRLGSPTLQGGCGVEILQHSLGSLQNSVVLGRMNDVHTTS
jgi:hypothetical protein